MIRAFGCLAKNTVFPEIFVRLAIATVAAAAAIGAMPG
jgi:hypothetical protein